MKALDLPAGRLRKLAFWFVFAWFLLGGIAHFVFTQAEMRIVPSWIPWPRAAVLVSGALELAGAAGLLLPSWRRAAAAGLFLLTIAVTPANVHMLLHPELFPSVPYWALVARLPLQLVLLALIAQLALRRRAATDFLHGRGR
jgi:uncharacterized membrane protein